jgi:hypothetical protein
MPNFTTGPATLPDVGILMYNSCVFSPLYVTDVAGVVVKDAANRTTKYMEYTITVDGYVTLPDNVPNIDATMAKLRQLLTAQGGTLQYEGRGNSIVVNVPGSAIQDVAWGPIPEVLDFQPLGGGPLGGRSAKIKWQVKVRIPEVPPMGGRFGPVLQFNMETVVSYDEAAYSTLAIRGTLEIPLTRVSQPTRTLALTVDNFRQEFMQQVASSIDLTRFRVTRREFQISRDKRTMEWDFAAEELPPMGLPPGVPVARGTFDVRPAKAGMGLVSWLCTLRVTYTVRKDWPRRTAWEAFLLLLTTRMLESSRGIGGPPNGPQNPGAAARIGAAIVLPPVVTVVTETVNWFRNRRVQQAQQPQVQNARRAWLIDFNISEGLYLDSKTVTFSATWRLITVFSEILLASGLWTPSPADGGDAWKASVQNISGWRGNLINRIDPTQDVIVDFGGQQ